MLTAECNSGRSDRTLSPPLPSVESPWRRHPKPPEDSVRAPAPPPSALPEDLSFGRIPRADPLRAPTNPAGTRCPRIFAVRVRAPRDTIAAGLAVHSWRAQQG